MRFTQKLRRSLCAGAILLSLTSVSEAGNDPLIGELMLFGGNFCPRLYLPADGRLLPISSNTSLFSIIGTYYGGDGRATFALPDLRGRAPIGVGTGPGLSTFAEGDQAGSEQQQILIENMPGHRHDVFATNEYNNKPGPGGKYLAASSEGAGAPPYRYSNTETPNKKMGEEMIGFTGGDEPLNIRGPVLALQWCIAVAGTYPSRN